MSTITEATDQFPADMRAGNPRLTRLPATVTAFRWGQAMCSSRVRARWILPASLALAGACAQSPGGDSNDDLLYVLQPDALSTADLTSTGFHWLILEPTRDGGATGDFTVAEIAQIREGGPCLKLLLAYLSIGEAETYRDYWDPAWVDMQGNPIPGVAPAWLGPLNPDFPDNYKVRYWDPDWQALLWGTSAGPGQTPLDRILAQGFDGVYLDIIDAYEFWSSAAGGFELTRVEARRRMIDLVEALGNYAQQTGANGFLVFPQNAADIIRDDNEQIDAESRRYFEAIDGIGQEDLFYDELTPQPESEIAYVLEQLREYHSRGKIVLVTDYVVDEHEPGPGSNDARVTDFHSCSRAEGFVPYAAHRDRELHEIVTFGGRGWSVSQPSPGCSSPGIPTVSE